MVRIIALFGIIIGNFVGLVWPAAAADATKIVVFGDSLVAGYGIGQNESFPAQLEAALKEKGHNVEVLRAGISGDTTAGGRARVDSALKLKPDVAVVVLGGNDMLRGLPPAHTRDNLSAILAAFHEQKVKIVLAGMKAPQQLGVQYTKAFDAIYPELAKEYDARLYPFFLEDVYGNPTLNLNDGIHPTAEGIAVIVKRILPLVEEALE